MIYSSFKTIVSGLIVFYWTIALLVPKRHHNKFEIYGYIGNSLNWIIVRLLKLIRFPEFKELSKIPFEYPIRIKAAGIIASGICILTALAVIFYIGNIWFFLYI